MQTKEEMKQLAHLRFKEQVQNWMNLNNLTGSEAASVLGVTYNVIHTWINRPNDPKFPTFTNFLRMVAIIEESSTQPQGVHGRKLNYVRLLTGRDKTDYETRLEDQLRSFQSIIEQQKGAIAYLESKLTPN